MSKDNSPKNQILTYRDAGVDIDAGDAFVEQIKPMVKRTMRPEVLNGIGGFGALIGLGKRYRDPVLVAGTDGVGTKLRLAFELDRHDTIGIDLVAMSVNDILVQGAEPLFFLDYFSCGKLDIGQAARVVQGIAVGCEKAGCALVGGETAEMPDMYPPGEYDLAGFAVGVAERDALIDGSAIAAGDIVLGLASSGPHSNGYSLIRKIIQVSGVDLKTEKLGNMRLADALMAPTHIYVRSVLALMKALPVKGMAHITGGGLPGNVPRVLPAGLDVCLSRSAWQRNEVFDWLQREGNVDEDEMLRVFNCGVGMVIIVDDAHAEKAIALLTEHGEKVARIGEVVMGKAGESRVMVEN